MFYLLLLIQLLVFGGLALLLRQLLTRNITGATAHLQQLSHDYTKKEEQATKRLEETEQYYQKTLVKAQEEIHQLKAQFEKETQEAKDKILKQAHIESEEIVQRANKTKQVILSEIEDRIAKEAIEKENIKIETAEIDKIPNTTVKIQGDKVQTMLKLITELEDNDDITKIFSNYDISDEDMESFYNN